MDQNMLKKLLAQSRATEEESTAEEMEEPSVENTSFIPSSQRSNIVLMTSKPLVVEDMATLMFGVIRKNYTKEMWQYDIDKWTKCLGSQRNYYIQMDPLSGRDALNSSDAIPKMEKALEHVNQLAAGEKLRIIVLGTGHAAFLYEALTYILREWKEPSGEPRSGKYMQFITSGDTKDRDWSHYCQWLCIAGICENVEFYNTRSYHPFGFCSAEFHS